MAALRIIEDNSNRKLIMKPPLAPRLIGLLGLSAWFVLIAAIVLAPQLGGGQFNWLLIGIFFLIVLFSFGSSLVALAVSATVELDSKQRTLTRVTRILIFPVRSKTLAFKELANIETQFYRHSWGWSSHDAYRVGAITRDGLLYLLKWDGKRDEMRALAQKISTLTGAPVLDHSAKPERILPWKRANSKGTKWQR